MTASYRTLSVGLLAIVIALTGRAFSAAAEAARVAKAGLDTGHSGQNLLKPDAWRPWQKGFERQGGQLVCDNGPEASAQRGASQTVVLNQAQPEPIVAVAWSKAEGVTGGADNDYALYLDLVYADGNTLWGQTAPFQTGSHDWQRRQVLVLPEKPVKSLSYHLLLRGHGGKAWFRDPELRVVSAPEGACTFDGVPVTVKSPPREGFQVRDVAAGSDFVRIDREALGLKLEWKQSEAGGATFIDATLTDATGKDRAVTLIYAVPVAPKNLRWLDGPRQSREIQSGREYVNASQFRAGRGRLSYYPLGAVAGPQRGTALGIDMAQPAFYRVGYHAATGELFLAYDIGLAREKPAARVRFCRFAFDPAWGFRSALAKYYEIFPDHFRCRTPEQGLWMPFAKISAVKGWEDFGFKFKEGDDETKWDDEHGIITFRYTEPMTWWMRMPKEMPRSMEAAIAEARRLADKGDKEAKSLFASGYHDESGQFPARLLDTPWCNGAVWSMNSMPGISGEVTDFTNKWNQGLRERLYGPGRKADLDGEYIDSSEGYVTDELNFRRDHFAAATTPLCFSPDTYQPAIFRGLIVFEYIRGIADDLHGMGKRMMANSTPIRLCWLAPLLEVMGTETDWNHQDAWRPMSDADLLYRRAMCKGKPYCFLMNTQFEKFPYELVEKYMKRSLAYGMFPGFFSHNASQGHYFTRPELYDRDRPLFKKYVPLCKLVAEAGWEPVTAAASDDERVYVERFGRHYLTVFNDSQEPKTVTVTLQGSGPATSRDLVSGKTIAWKEKKATLTLQGEDVAVLEMAQP
ncbi:MAG: hypothetical protein HUU20_05570 [Pirellulales bacterium]|nr:hypothetical protein [Pirellulales bacterium]